MPDIRVSGVLVREGRIVLVRRRDATAWELPGGPLEDGDETTEASLVRHLRRLLGVEPGEPEFVETLYRPGAGGWALENLFLVPAWSGLPANRAPADLAEVTTYELSALGYLPMDDVLRRAVQGLLGLGPPLSAGVATRVVILSGPPGAGRTAVARALCRRLGRAAHVEVDVLRRMAAGGGEEAAPADPVEAARRSGLAVRNAADLARNFAAAGLHVVVEDAVEGPSLQEYLAALAEAPADLYLVTLDAPPEAGLPGLRLAAAGRTADQTAEEAAARLREALLERRPAW